MKYDKIPLRDALEAARTDSELRLHLVTAMCVMANESEGFGRKKPAVEDEERQAKKRKTGAQRRRDWAERTVDRQEKGNGKGGEDKGKGKAVPFRLNEARRLKMTLHSKTADGVKEICWAFNKPTGCSGQCSRAQICILCRGEHTLEDCPSWDNTSF